LRRLVVEKNNGIKEICHFLTKGPKATSIYLLATINGISTNGSIDIRQFPVHSNDISSDQKSIICSCKRGRDLLS
jgi:hypothetical protein